MTLKDLKQGEKFSNLSLIIKDFRKNGKQFDLTLTDKGGQMPGYVMANLYDYDQLMAMKGKPVCISGLFEPALDGLFDPRIKVKDISHLPEDGKEAEELDFRIKKDTCLEYWARIKELKQFVGRDGDLSYRFILEQYFTKENLALMMSMPATHTRQGAPQGGMLHATLAVTDMAYNLADRYIKCGNGIYSFNDERCIDWDLLITGGLLHLAGNFLYFEKEYPHRKRTAGVERGYPSCLEQVVHNLIEHGNVDISEEAVSALLGVMSRLNEQQIGVNKCRQEAVFLNAAYRAFWEMDSFDAEVAEVLHKRSEKKKGGQTPYDFSESLGCYISKTEIDRKSELLGLKTDEGGEGNAE